MHLRVCHALQQRARLQEECGNRYARQILPGHELLHCTAQKSQGEPAAKRPGGSEQWNRVALRFVSENGPPREHTDSHDHARVLRLRVLFQPAQRVLSIGDRLVEEVSRGYRAGHG